MCAQPIPFCIFLSNFDCCVVYKTVTFSRIFTTDFIQIDTITKSINILFFVIKVVLADVAIIVCNKFRTFFT